MSSTDKKCRTCIIIDDVSARLSKADDDVAESKITENRYLKICATSKKLYENLLELCSCDENCDGAEICEILGLGPDDDDDDDDDLHVIDGLIEDRYDHFSLNCDSFMADSLYENRENIYVAEFSIAHTRAQEYDLHQVYTIIDDRPTEIIDVYWKVEIGVHINDGYIYTPWTIGRGATG